MLLRQSVKIRLVVGVLLAAIPGLPQNSTVWRAGDGAWNEATRWSAGLPNPSTGAEISGNSQVIVPPGTWVASDLRIGNQKGDRSRVEVTGGSVVLVNDSLFVGDDSGSQGELILNSGALHSVMDVFVGAATATTRRANDATLRIRGGSFMARNLSVGFGFGSHALVAVEGSQASAIHLLDYFYLRATTEPDGRPGLTTLCYTLDEHGVTPITIQSRSDGLRIEADSASRCRLEILLRVIPPPEDVTLVSSNVPIKGAFWGLPEGSEIAASYGGNIYLWTITYRGGTSGHDLVLLSRNKWPAGTPVTHVRLIPQPPVPLWRDHPTYPAAIEPGKPAFPGAQGYGAFSRGGPEGRKVFVDNLNESGPGSFRAAVESQGPRIVVFRVGGTISLRTRLSIRNPFLKVDAQSAPAEGITLVNHGIDVSTHDVVLRYLRIRVGDAGVNPAMRFEAGEGEDGLRFESGASDCIADHLSLSWTTGKIITITPTADRITIQWCILSESLNFAGHGYASLAGGKRVSWHHNLLAHNYSRNVRLQGAVDADFRNNVVYDWGDAAGYGEFDRLNYVGNLLKPGPSTTQKTRLFMLGDHVVLPGSIFVEGNVLDGDLAVTQDNWRGMGYYYFDRDTLKAGEPFPAPPVSTEPAAAAYEHVIQDAGDTLPRRDPVDQRIVREVQEGSGHIIRWVREAGQQ
jgi:hypothetical protein